MLVNIPWMVGNSDDFRETPARMGAGETVLVLVVFCGFMLVVGLIWLVTLPLRIVFGCEGPRPPGCSGAGDPDLHALDQNMRIVRGEFPR